MNNRPYQSHDYPTLTQLIELSHLDYLKLRRLMLERGELSKFIAWQRGKFIRLISTGFTPDPLTKGTWNANPSTR